MKTAHTNTLLALSVSLTHLIQVNDPSHTPLKHKRTIQINDPSHTSLKHNS